MAAPFRLLFLAVALVTALLFLPGCAGFLRLLRRSRWLLIMLFATYALSMPGALLWPALGGGGPTLEGVQSGALRVARLVLMLAGLAVLLATTDRPRLILGLYALTGPLVWLGFDRRAFAVRLGLALDYAGRGRTGSWQEAFARAGEDDGQPDRLLLPAARWQTRDSAVILAAVLLLVFAWT